MTKEKFKKRLMAIVILLAVLIIAGAILTYFNNKSVNNFKNDVYKTAKANGALFNDLKSKSYVTITAPFISAAFLGTFLIFAILNIRNDNEKRWPYITLLVISILGFAFGAYQLFSISHENGYLINFKDDKPGEHFKPIGIAAAESHWGDYKTTVYILRSLIVAKSLIIAIAALFGSILVKNYLKVQGVKKAEIIKKNQEQLMKEWQDKQSKNNNAE